MSSPPPRPPPPTKHTTPTHKIQNTQSEPQNEDTGSGMQTDQQTLSKIRGRSSSYSGHLPHKKPLPLEPLKPSSTNPPPFRHSPPPTVIPSGETGNRGRGRGRSAGRVPPTRPPPPARAKSLPRGTRLKMWEQANGSISDSHSKSSDNVTRTSLIRDVSQSPVHVSSPDSILNSVHKSQTEDITPEEKKDSGDVIDNDGDIITNSSQEQSNQTEELTRSKEKTAASLSDTTPTPVQPVIPQRPYLPPRPFPPPSSPQTTTPPSSKYGKRTYKTHHGDPRHRPPQHRDTESATDDALSKSVEVTPTDHVTSRDNVTTQATPPTSTGTVQPSSTTEASPKEEEEEEDEESEQPQPQSRILYNADTATPSQKPQRRTNKGRLMNSVRKGLSKIRKGNSRTSSVPTSRPPAKLAISRMASESVLIEADETEEQYPDPLPQGLVDPLVVLCVAYLNRDSVLREVGLFRIPGDVASVKKLRTGYIRGEPINLMEILDPHTVAGLLKYHFREWRVSIIPRGKPLEEVTAAVKNKDEETVQRVLQSLSQDSIATLRIVTELLSKVVEYSDLNKMTAGTLATSCGQSFFPYLPASPANTLLKFMIDHCSSLFPE